MFGFLMIIVHWVAGMLRSGKRLSRLRLTPVPIAVTAVPYRIGGFHTCSARVGWMTLQLDSVPRRYGLSRCSPAQGGGNLRTLAASKPGISCSLGSSVASKSCAPRIGWLIGSWPTHRARRAGSHRFYRGPSSCFTS